MTDETPISATEALGMSLVDGSYADSSMTEFAALAEAAAAEHPDDSVAIYLNAMRAKSTRDFEAAIDIAKQDSAFYDRMYHGPAAEGIMSVTGVSPDEYSRALDAHKAGDPSPLLALRTRYMSSMAI